MEKVCRAVIAVSIFISVGFFSSIAKAEDPLLKDALVRQLKIWDAEVQEKQQSAECYNAIQKAWKTSLKEEELVAVTETCKGTNDQTGTGLISIAEYLKLSSSKDLFRARPLMIRALQNAQYLLESNNLDQVLRASLTALATEVEFENNRYSEVIKLTIDADEQFAKLGISDSVSLAIALANSGYVKYRANDLDGALHQYLSAEKMLLRLNRADHYLGRLYHRMGLAYTARGDIIQAVVNYDKANSFLDQSGQIDYSVVANFNKAGLLLDLGLYDLAISAYTEAKNIYLLYGQEKPLADCLYGLGKAWDGKGMLDRAINLFDQAERLYGERTELQRLAPLYVSQCIVQQKLMTQISLKKAMKYCEKSENIYRDLGSDIGVGTALLNKGKLYERLGNPDEAMKAYLVAEKYLGNSYWADRSAIYNNIAYLAASKKDYSRALSYATRALKSLEEGFNYGLYLGGERSIAFRDQHLSSYVLATEALVEMGNVEEAYKMRERGRSKIFQMMSQLRAAAEDDPAVKEQWLKKKELQRQITTFDQQSVQKPPNDPESLTLAARRSELDKRLAQTERDIIAKTELYQKVSKHDIPFDPKKLRSVLKPNEAVIDYQVRVDEADGIKKYRINIFVSRYDKCTVVSIPKEKDLGRSILEYVDLLKPQALQNYAEKGELEQYQRTIKEKSLTLGNELLGKLDLLGVTKLYIIPDSILNLIPFETLRDQNGNLVVEHYAVAYLNSAVDVYRTGGKSNDGLVIFGDMVYGHPVNGLREWPPISMSPEALADIEKTAKEQMPVTYIHGPDATESNFTSMAPGHKVVLIWSHGALDDYEEVPQKLKETQDAKGNIVLTGVDEFKVYQNYFYKNQFNDPLTNSYIVFSGVNKGGDNINDGYLTAREVMDLNLEGTDLTILAACETGLGKASPSEGIIGLRRSFSVAGSRNLLLSLWKVDASWTGELVKMMLGEYYKVGGARALQQAKLAVIEKLKKDGIEPLPFYWAAFVLVGKDLEYIVHDN